MIRLHRRFQGITVYHVLTSAPHIAFSIPYAVYTFFLPPPPFHLLRTRTRCLPELAQGFSFTYICRMCLIPVLAARSLLWLGHYTRLFRSLRT
jgi:hypothetical protein